MQIQLTENGRIPSGIKAFYVVRAIRSGARLSFWTNPAEAQADCDKTNRSMNNSGPFLCDVARQDF